MRAKIGLLVWACGMCLPAQASVDVCGFYRDVYQHEIKAKIEAGVPFELMSTVFENGRLIEKKALRVGYNLWDEVVTLKSGEETVARFSLPEGEAKLCHYLVLGDSLSPGRKYVFRLLLNPLWGERLTRLQLQSGDAGHGKVLDVDWRRLANDMPSDKVLLEKEIQR